MRTTVTSTGWLELADSSATRAMVTIVMRQELSTPRRMWLVEAVSKAAAGLVDGAPPPANTAKVVYFDTNLVGAFATEDLAALGNKLFAQADGMDVEIAVNITA